MKKDTDRDDRKESSTRKEAGSREEKVAEDSGEPGKEISCELEEKKELDKQKRKNNMVNTKRVPETAMEEIKRTLDVVRIENEDSKNVGDTERREDKASDQPEDEDKKTPKKHTGTLSRLAAKLRPELAGHVPNVARRQEGRKLKNTRERKRGSAIERGKKNRIKFEEIRSKGDRHTEEDSDPPEKVRQTHGRIDERKEETRI